jgi:hypothetical protein
MVPALADQTQQQQSEPSRDHAPTGHVFTDSFPTHDEYDMMALDPELPYGTPYGGFSRATASRLARLPLKLPNVGEELEDFEPMYTTVRDVQGRPFVCRVYHQDELTKESLEESMFNTPILTSEEKTATKDGDNGEMSHRPAEASDETDRAPQPAEEMIQDGPGKEADKHTQDNLEADATATASSAATGHDSTPVPGERTTTTSGATQDASTKTATLDMDDPILRAHDLQQRLQQLQGLCAQMHPDWWSYEWCYQEKVTQFHINLEMFGNGVGQTKEVQLEDITSLGSFSHRRIEMKVDTSKDPNSIDRLDFAEGRPELARVYDTFVGGTTCPETGKPRVTQSTLRCCSQRILAQTKGGVLKNGRPVATDLLTIVQTSEWDQAVCHYNVTLCTPLLCGDVDTPRKDKVNDQFKDVKKRTVNLDLDPEEVEKMSVMEVLSKTFGENEEFCIQTGTGGWWVYEFCLGDGVRQFHETTLLDRITGKATTAIETEHVLGRYIAEDHEGVTKENEWKNVVNATENGLETSSNSQKSRSIKVGSPTSLGGNGAYYFQEYTKGDVCDDETVTDVAIKAGEFGDGGIERATTVRYSCGVAIDMTVKEDSTCHYIVDISVPTLCHHPLFKAPTSKKQVVKCLPMQVS